MKKSLTIPLAVVTALAMGAFSANAAGPSSTEVEAITQKAIAKQMEEDRATWASKMGVALSPSGQTVMRFDFDAPGCEVKGPDGKPISFNHAPGNIIKLPRGTTVTGACMVSNP